MSAEVATVEKSATEARAVTVFAKMVSSPSLKDKIINFPSGSPPSITRHFSYRSTSSKRFDATPVSYTHLDVYKRQVLESGDTWIMDCFYW